MRTLCMLAVCTTLWQSVRGEGKKPPSNAEKIVGVWEAVKGTSPPGYMVEFTKDGKFKLTAQVSGGGAFYCEGTYKVKGDKLITTAKDPDGKDKTTSVKIKALTDKQLIVDAGEVEASVFKRKK